jgi:hypothetical protein
MTDAPVAGTVSRIPGKLLQAIRVPAFTSAIVASAPMTVIDPGVIAERHYNDPLHWPFIAPRPPGCQHRAPRPSARIKHAQRRVNER